MALRCLKLPKPCVTYAVGGPDREGVRRAVGKPRHSNRAAGAGGGDAAGVGGDRVTCDGCGAVIGGSRKGYGRLPIARNCANISRCVGDGRSRRHHGEFGRGYPTPRNILINRRCDIFCPGFSGHGPVHDLDEFFLTDIFVQKAFTAGGSGFLNKAVFRHGGHDDDFDLGKHDKVATTPSPWQNSIQIIKQQNPQI